MTLDAPNRIRSTRVRLRWEIVIVLGLSLLPSALIAMVSLLELAVAPTPIGDTTAELNPSASAFPVFDFALRLIRLAATLVPVALVIWLLWTRRESGFSRIGLDARRPGLDLAGGVLLALAIGLPGLVLYATSRALGLTVQVVAGDTQLYWWSALLLVLSALRAALLEEVIAVAYLATRLRTLGWSRWGIIVASALLRASYHLYQGVPMALGNFVMGLLFAWVYTRPGRRGGRVMPLVIAHLILDLVSFLGYPLAVVLFPGLF